MMSDMNDMKYTTLSLRKLFPFVRIQLICVSKPQDNHSKDFFSRKKLCELKIIRIFAVNPFSIPWCIKIFQGKSLKFLFAKVSARKVYSFCKPSKFNNMWNQKEKTTERLIERHLIVKFRIYFTYCSGASIVDFEQVNASCVKNQISNQYYFQHL